MKNSNTNIIIKQGNFELLRIFSMILIILHHYSIHGGLFSNSSTISSQLIANLLIIGGKVGVNLFVLISGYFLIESKFKIQKVLKLLFQIVFYTILLFIGIYFITGNFYLGNISILFKPISLNLYWFITAYLEMYILSPFIRKALENVSKAQYQSLLILFGIFLSVIPTFFNGSNLVWGNGIWFVYVFAIGGYIKKYEITLFNKKGNCIILSILLYLITYILLIICKYSKIHHNTFLNMNSINIFLVSICIFCSFKHLTIKPNKLLLLLSQSSFAVYLLHDNEYFRYNIWNILKTSNFIDKPILTLILHIILSTIILYLLAVIIETIRRKLIEEPIFKTLEKSSLIENINKIINI